MSTLSVWTCSAAFQTLCKGTGFFISISFFIYTIFFICISNFICTSFFICISSEPWSRHGCPDTSFLTGEALSSFELLAVWFPRMLAFPFPCFPLAWELLGLLENGTNWGKGSLTSDKLRPWFHISLKRAGRTYYTVAQGHKTILGRSAPSGSQFSIITCLKLI